MKQNYYDNFYIFGNKLKEIFVFNYKIIIINFLLRFSLLDSFEYIFLVQYFIKEQAWSQELSTFLIGFESSRRHKKEAFFIFESLL